MCDGGGRFSEMCISRFSVVFRPVAVLAIGRLNISIGYVDYIKLRYSGIGRQLSLQMCESKQNEIRKTKLWSNAGLLDEIKPTLGDN